MKVTLEPRLSTQLEAGLTIALILAMYGAAKVFIRHDAHAVWVLILAGGIAAATLIVAGINKLARNKAKPDERSQLKL